MAKVAVILGGCGRMDGSEIHESVCALLALDRRDAEILMFAPDILQAETVNHLTNKVVKEKRNVLIESARIARGAVKNIKELNVNDVDALIFPGGSGIAKNLFTYGLDGPDFKVNQDIEVLIAAALGAGKPMGFICIAPVLLAKVASKIGMSVRVTIGEDEGTAKTIESMGIIHQQCAATDVVVDEEHKLVTTPAYMLGKRISEVAQGIDQLVEKVLAFI